MCNRDDELSHTRIVSQISAFQEMETPMTDIQEHSYLNTIMQHMGINITGQKESFLQIS